MIQMLRVTSVKDALFTSLIGGAIDLRRRELFVSCQDQTCFRWEHSFLGVISIRLSKTNYRFSSFILFL